MLLEGRLSSLGDASGDDTPVEVAEKGFDVLLFLTWDIVTHV